MKVFLAGLAIIAAAVGGGIGYASTQTAIRPEWATQVAPSPTAIASSDRVTDASGTEPSAITDSSTRAIRETSRETVRKTNQETNQETSRAPNTDRTAATTDYEATARRAREDFGNVTVTPATSSPEDFGDVIITPVPSSPEDFGSVVVTPVTTAEDIVISEDELGRMVTEAIASYPPTAAILGSSQGVQTSIKDGQIESGVVMNLANLPLEALPPEGQEAIVQITKTFPFLASRNVYFGIEGSPAIVEGKFSLDDTHIKIGQLKLPVANVASQFGVSQTDIEKQLGNVLEQQGLTPEDVQIVNGRLVIRGGAR